MTIRRNRPLFSCVHAPILLLIVMTPCEFPPATAAQKGWTLTPLAARSEDPDRTSIYDQNDFMQNASPDGEHLVFTSRRSGEFRQYVMKVDGSDVRVLTSGPGRQMQGIWSPDGKRIVYLQRDDTGRRLIVVNADGSDPKTIADDPGGWVVPSWSKGGELVLYHALGPNGFDDIWTVDVETGERKVLIGSAAADRQASISPDGSRLVLISRRDGDDYEIYVVRLNGGPWKQLTDNNENDFTPSWSRDGSRILFQSARAGKWTILTINADGTDEKALTQYPAQYDPVWSADGSEIFFNSDRDGRRGIYVMNADGLNPRKLTNTEPSTFVAAVWEEGVEEAARVFREARKKNPGAVYFYEEEVQYLGENYLEMGHLRQAALLFEINVEAYPESKSAHMNLGRSRLAAGEVAQAIRSYQRAFEIDTEDKQIPVLLDQLEGKMAMASGKRR